MKIESVPKLDWVRWEVDRQLLRLHRQLIIFPLAFDRTRRGVMG